MLHNSWPMYRLLLPILLSPAFTYAKNHHNNDDQLFHFVTRPELKPPKWDVTIYDGDKLTQGYWFLGIKPGLETTLGSGKGWYGPVIYDGNGELIWSGAAQLDTPNVMDFRISELWGEKHMSMCDRDRASSVFLDSTYEISNLIITDHEEEGLNVNGHEHNVVENGNSVLVLRNHKIQAPPEQMEAVGYDPVEWGPKCIGQYNTIHELNLTTGESVFDWESFGHIGLDESTQTEGKVKDRCHGGWDFIHPNSIDKSPDGDYILSGRHCDTIYKISKDDGSVVWRLGGKNSDFEHIDGLEFSRQHDIRCRGQNQTHVLLSMLDNAKGQDDKKASHEFSRGILIALRTDTTPMTAELVHHYDHPDHQHVKRRGNMHIMDNGNVFMGWSERAWHSEHSEDGTLLMEARLQADWLGSYRNYKFPFVGRPAATPDVVSRAYLRDENQQDNPVTHVFVSWNGDTEVDEWRLYGIADGNDTMELLNSTRRTSFETQFDYKGYAKSVLLEGVNKDGDVIGKSAAIKTIPHPSMPTIREHYALAEALVTCREPKHKMSEEDHGFFGHPSVVFTLGCICSAGVLLLGWIGVLPLMKRFPRMRDMLPKKEEAGIYEQLEAEESDMELPLRAEKRALRPPRSLTPEGSEREELYSDQGQDHDR